MKLIERLSWRYATKKMTTDKVVPQEKIDNILEAIRLSASSLGLQPYQLILVKNKEILKELQVASHNQAQVTAATAVIVFAVWDKPTKERVDNYFFNMAKERNMSIENLAPFRGMVDNFLNKDEATLLSWMTHQAYIGLGTGLVAAAFEEVDSTPMEGFIPAEVDRILDLGNKGLKSVLLLPIGFREESDILSKAKKVRKPLQDFVLNMN